MYDAALRGDVETLKKLLKAKNEPLDYRDVDGETALHKAARGRNAESVAELLRAGGMLAARARNNVGWGPLHCAARAGMLEGIAPLIAAGAEKDAKTRVRSVVIVAGRSAQCLPTM